MDCAYYSGKKVLITGGSSGIGRAVALELARQGADVVVAARGIPRLVETVENLRAEIGGSASCDGRIFGHVALDVTDDVSISAGVVSALDQLGGRIDVLICCSGFTRCGTAWDLPIDAYTRLMDVNYFGHVRVVRAIVPHMRDLRSGDILLVSSIGGFFGVYGYGAYCASKYAITGFAEALRQELLFDGIKLKMFYPPTTETPGLDLENEDKPELCWIMESDNSFTKLYKAETVAKAVTDCIPSNRFENMVGFDSWFLFRASRLFPRLARWLADQEFRAAKKKVDSNKAILKPTPESSHRDTHHMLLNKAAE